MQQELTRLLRAEVYRTMTKTITAAFDVPDSGSVIRISLLNTHGIAVGATLRIGFDSYTIINVDQLGVTIMKHKTPIPAGMDCFIEN